MPKIWVITAKEGSGNSWCGAAKSHPLRVGAGADEQPGVRLQKERKEDGRSWPGKAEAPSWSPSGSALGCPSAQWSLANFPLKLGERERFPVLSSSIPFLISRLRSWTGKHQTGCCEHPQPHWEDGTHLTVPPPAKTKLRRPRTNTPTQLSQNWPTFYVRKLITQVLTCYAYVKARG